MALSASARRSVTIFSNPFTSGCVPQTVGCDVWAAAKQVARAREASAARRCMCKKNLFYRAGVRSDDTDRLWDVTQNCVGRGLRKSSGDQGFPGSLAEFQEKIPLASGFMGWNRLDYRKGYAESRRQS